MSLLDSMPTDEEVERRKQLTFEQAEGAEPLPAQMNLKELSTELRARLWKVVFESFKSRSQYPSMGGRRHFTEPWSEILYAMHVYRDHGMADDFRNDFDKIVKRTRQVFETGDYVAVFGWLQWVMQKTKPPYQFARQIDGALVRSRAPYRVFDEKVIVPITSEAERQAVARAFADLSQSVFRGARKHLVNAASELTEGRFANSVRESIHAVESVARVIEPSAELSRALVKLESAGRIHRAMKSAFGSLYGYTSDEQGIRHPLLEGESPNVDEVDAIFMIGACASFVSYLVGKGRAAGVLSAGD